MEKRVIKFNLVGAICVLILVITFIVGLIVGIPKLTNKSSTKDGNSNKVEDEQNFIEEIDEEKIEKDVVYVQGEEKELQMKTLKGTLGYTIKYECTMFVPRENINGIDSFISLYSDTISINILKEKQNIFENIENFIDEERRLHSAEDYSYINEEINGQRVLRKTFWNGENISYTYYIESKDNGYFIVDIQCGKNFEQDVIPITRKMIESFKVL